VSRKSLFTVYYLLFTIYLLTAVTESLVDFLRMFSHYE